VASRKSNFWSGIVGGALGVGLIWSSALEASMQSTEGGTFGIALIGTSETESSSMTEPEEKPKTKNLEEELNKLKDLFEKGLIDEDVYKEMQKELLLAK